jgi:hypothetical protein
MHPFISFHFISFCIKRNDIKLKQMIGNVPLKPNPNKRNGHPPTSIPMQCSTGTIKKICIVAEVAHRAPIKNSISTTVSAPADPAR